MVVMDKEDYITKVESLLSQPAYRVLPRDPTNQSRLNSLLNSEESKRTKTWKVCIKLCILQVAFPQVLWVT